MRISPRTPRVTIPCTTAADSAADRLSATTDRRGTAVVLRPRGEIDAYTLQIWQRLIRQASAAAEPPGPIVLDTTGIEFMSCTALGVLADEADRCRRHGIALHLAGDQPAIVRLITVAGLSEKLPSYSGVDSALIAAESRLAPPVSSGSAQPPQVCH
ncbi:anti-sigma factor antagonist [Nocardia alni]|uniref:anti-sigma factor antagonist n=1 Tax=Nocardia alni TaxID=2815723 RepID=UPI001C235D18|nr:anti-sigma factor antagonist [Nocardia alni]